MDMQKDKLYLYPGYRDKLSGNKVEYDLMTYDCHDGDFKGFHLLATEVLIAIFSGHTVLSKHDFMLKKAPQKRLFSADIPSEFYENKEVSELLELIASKRRDWNYCFKNNSDRSKTFFVSAPKIDLDFIKSNSDEILNSISLIGYNTKHFDDTKNVERMAEDFTLSFREKGQNYAIRSSMDNTHNILKITLNPWQYPVRGLTERIETALQKHGKTLEVEI